MNPRFHRALRTLLQALAGIVTTELIADVFFSLNEAWYPVIAIALTTLISQAQNALEDAGKVPTILKPDPENPGNPNHP